jgi:hypothetical protein
LLLVCYGGKVVSAVTNAPQEAPGKRIVRKLFGGVRDFLGRRVKTESKDGGAT